MKKPLYIIYIFLWILFCVLFWVFNIDPMFYSIVTFYVGLPLVLFLIGLFGVEETNFKTHVIFIILAFSYMLEEYVTYSLANMIEFNKINMPEISMFIRAIALLYIGLVIRNMISNK